MAEEKKMPSKELIEKAQKCETPEQLIELAKTEGIELTKEQAEAFLAQLQDVELDGENLKKAAGGKKFEPMCLWDDGEGPLRQPCIQKMAW